MVNLNNLNPQELITKIDKITNCYSKKDKLYFDIWKYGALQVFRSIKSWSDFQDVLDIADYELWDGGFHPNQFEHKAHWILFGENEMTPPKLLEPAKISYTCNGKCNRNTYDLEEISELINSHQCNIYFPKIKWFRRESTLKIILNYKSGEGDFDYSYSSLYCSRKLGGKK